MTIKKIEDMNHYELLSLERTAMPEDIEQAYLLGIAAYQPDSLASYGLVPEEERKLILKRLEEAYQTLRDGEKRTAYDAEVFGDEPAYEPKAHFRKSTGRVEIGDAQETKGFLKKLKKCFFSLKPSDGAGRIKSQVFYRGEYLKGVRQNRGLSLEDISMAIKISVSELKALEEEDSIRLPKGKNIPHLLKLYARFLGLNSSEQ